MKDLKDSRLMWLKAWMFLLIGIIAFALVLLENPDLRNGLLLLMMVWAFCRAYYFAFHVIEHYVDGGFRYAGLIDFVKRRLIRHNRR
jgi:hypothetical protein